MHHLHQRRPTPLAAGLLLAILALNGWAATPPLRLIPMPPRVTRTPDQPLGRAALVLPPNPTAKMNLAADEINLRLRDLDATPLPVVTEGSDAEKRFKGRRIELTVTPAKDRTPTSEQRYYIDTRGDPKRSLLMGGDDQGLLWAAVTFRRMLARRDDGQLVVLGAEFRDGPQFPRRMMNRFTKYHREHTERGLYSAIKKGDDPDAYAEGYVADGRRIIDFLFRLKLNLTWLPLYGVPSRLDELTEAIGGADKAERLLATLRRVTDYAAARGVAVCDVQMSHIGISPRDDADPAISRCVLHRSHKKYFCWSLDDLNRRKAEQTARFFARAGYTMITLHNVDGGGTADPAYWSRRCAHCRERWGDDRAAADAHLYGLWHDAFRRIAPNVAFAAIQYPYNATILLQDTHPDYERTRAYWTSLHRRLPQDRFFSVCVRENVRPAIAAFYRIFATRPVLVYWMTDTVAGDHRWAPIFSSRVRYAKTFAQRGRRDWVFAYSSSCPPIAAIAGAQYLWNADSPGGGLWPGGIDVDRDGSEPAVFFEELLPQFVAELFGKRAVPHLTDTFRGCISPSYCMLPADVARMCRIPNTAARMEQQYDALVRAYGGIERLWQRLEAGDRGILKPGCEPYLYGLSEQVGRTRLWASYHLAKLRVSEALRAGTEKQAILDGLQAALPQVRADAALAERMNTRTRGKPKGGRADLNRWLRKPLQQRYQNTAYHTLIGDIESLRDVIKGRVVELAEARGETTVPVLPDSGAGLVLRGKGATKLSLVSFPTQGRGDTALQVEGLTQPWHDGLSVGFPPVDVPERLRSGGALRFYINGAARGNQQFTFWLYARDEAGTTTRAEEKGWMWVALRDHVAVDDFEATWQLVSIPLKRLLPEGFTRIVGFGMNNAVYDEVCGPVWIDTMYLCAGHEPVEREVAVQEPPPQDPATDARVTAVGVQPSSFVGGAGTESRLMLGLKLLGDGSLSNVRITLRFLAPDGALLRSERVVAAHRLRTPWWSPSLRFDLGRQVVRIRLEMILESHELKRSGSIAVTW